MFCTQCGKQIGNTAMRFCPACGHPIRVPAPAQAVPARPARPSFDYAGYVMRMKGGDQQAFQTLYEATYRDMYYLALKLMKNEAEAEDVLQDAYIKAWNGIGSLSDPNAFRGWLSRIVTNTAKNALAKNSPLLFSQMEGEDDEGEETAFYIADETAASQPELNYTEKETQDLVREMIASLSDEQRFCILMFHLENQSIREIAETLGVSENTVKSRLNYGRKNLAKKAEELQKKGYTLFTITPLPLLLYLLRCEKGSASAANAAGIAMQRTSGIVFSNLYAYPRVPANAYSNPYNNYSNYGDYSNYNNYNDVPSHRTAAEFSGQSAQSTSRPASAPIADRAAPAANTVKTAVKASFLSTAGGKIAVAAAAVVVAGGIFAGGVTYANHHGSSEPTPSVMEAREDEEDESAEEEAKKAAPSVQEAPAETASLADNEMPSEMEAPAESEAPEETEAPAESEAPEETEAPAESETPTETEAPAESETPAETEAPAESETPAETETPAEAETPEETEAPAVTEAPAETVSTDDLPNLISGNLTQYELETVLAYGPQDAVDPTDSEAQGIMNILIQATDPDTGAARFETGMMGYMTTISLEEINRYFSAFTDYQFSGDNIDLIERGRYIAIAPAQIEFTASASITDIAMGAGDLIITYDYFCRSYDDDGVTEISERRQAIFKQQPDGMYRLLLTTVLG